MLSDALPLACELPIPPDWGRLVEHLPFEWIEDALAYTGKASIRQRRLPAEQVVWLVIALALYRHRSIRQVIAELDLALPDMSERFVTASAVSQARQRLGAAPMRWLFEASAKAWSAHDAAHEQFHDFTLLAMDGTTLRLADSPANREHFGSGSFANNSIGSYPQTRGVTLCMLATQLVLGAQFSPFSTSEMAMAKDLLPQVPNHSLTVLDRGFWSGELLHQLVEGGEQRHFLIPAKANTKWKLIEGTATDGIVEMVMSPLLRKRNPELPPHWRARACQVIGPTGKTAYLVTSLIDRTKYSRKQLSDCYSRRWQIETSYRELKHTMLGMALTMRSQSVAGVEQEIYGALIAYNLVRVEMAKAAQVVKCEPTEVSFVLALHAIQFEMMSATAAMAPGNLPSLLKRMRERLVLELNVVRPGRKYDRVVKTRAQRYKEVRLKKQA